MTREEFLIFERQLQKYKVTRYSEYWKEDITIIDTDKWLEDMGALRKGAVVMKSDGFDYEKPLYVELQNKLEEFYRWVGKREYAKKMELKSHTESLAKSMKV
jgi:hypothetical protein